MKTILLSAAAVSMAIASPAFAAVNADRDGAGTYVIEGQAADYCVLGAIGENTNANGNNTTVDTSANAGNFGFNTSDATIHITQLQSDNNDHAKAWKAIINMPHSICNTAYNVTANSTNGGLQYTGGQTTGDTDFTTKLDYTVQAKFDGNDGTEHSASTIQGSDTQILSGSATAGDFKLIFHGAANNDQYLLSGDYGDTVVVRMSAATGTPT